MDIVVAGHICLDIIPKWEKGGLDSLIPGNLVEMDGIKFSTGGVVANTGIGLKRLGLNPTLIGKIGDDELGSIILKILKNVDDKLSTNMTISAKEISSYTVVLTPADTDRIFLHYPGTNHSFNSEDIPYQKLKEAPLFHFGYPPLMKEIYSNHGQELKEIMVKMQQLGVVTSLDMAMPDPASEAGKIDWRQLLKNVLPYVNIFLPSLDELLYMLDQKTYKRSLEEDVLNIGLLNDLGDELLAMGSEIVVIKLGARGLYLHTKDFKENKGNTLLTNIINIEEWSNKKIISPVFKAEVVGTTGSGDATIAGFLAEILQGSNPNQVMTSATAVGACSVEAVDATGGICHLNEVKERIKKGWKRRGAKDILEDLNLTDDWRYDENLGIWGNKG